MLESRELVLVRGSVFYNVGLNLAFPFRCFEDGAERVSQRVWELDMELCASFTNAKRIHCSYSKKGRYDWRGFTFRGLRWADKNLAASLQLVADFTAVMEPDGEFEILSARTAAGHRSGGWFFRY